jgi:RecA-family ATPase
MGEAIPFNPEEESRHRARRGRGEGAAPSGRDLPHSLEAEEHLLSCCLLDGSEAVARCLVKRVRPESFYDPKHAVIFEAIVQLFGVSAPIDPATVAEQLRSAGKLEAAGGYPMIAQVSKLSPTTAQLAHWIERVREQALLRDIIRAGTGMVEDAYAFTGDIEGFAGAASQKILAVTGDRTGLPAILRDEEFEACPLPVPPMLIDQVMHVGRRTMLIAPSKASKTWTAMDITCAVSTGSPWLGFKTHQVPVLHVDFELPSWGLKQRRQALREARGITKKMDVDWWSLDGYQRSIDELLPLISARAPLGKFGLIVVEPAYVIMGRRDENDNADVTDFMNQLAWLTRLTGAAVLCTHHMGKGAPGDKQVKDRASGAGAWMRAPDTAIMLTPLSEEQGDDVYSMEFIERNMKRHAPVGVRFEYPVFRLQSGLDLNALREAGRPKETTARDVVKVLEKEGGLTFSQWLKASGLSESSFKRRMKEAMDEGRVVKSGLVYSVKGES